MLLEPASKFEEAVLAKLLEGDLPELELLRAQLQSAQVRREWTGAGFWTEFAVEQAAPRLARRARLQITGVYGHHRDLKAGVGFTLFVEDGAVSSLEGYTYEEPWPANIGAMQIEQDPTGHQRRVELNRLFHRT